MTLNGTELSALGITPLKGAIENLFGNIQKKSLVFIENRTMHGSRAITANIKVKRRDNIVFPCYVKAATNESFLAKLNELEELLSDGKSGSGNVPTGVNELVHEGVKFRLVLTAINSLKVWRGGRGVMNFVFTELNPKNRAL